MNRTVLFLVLATLVAPAAAAELNLRGSLAGTNVVSATESPATGEVAAVLEDDNDLRIDMIYSGMATNATGAFLHLGKPNENGVRVAPLEIATGTTEGQLRGAVVRLTPQVAAQVRAGRSYVQIVSLDEPDGVVRAQLSPQATDLASRAANASAITRPAAPATAATRSASRAAVDGRATGTSTITPTNPVNDDDRDSDDD